jgi:hypothetical protein
MLLLVNVTEQLFRQLSCSAHINQKTAGDLKACFVLSFDPFT